jgi:hypothetical protein
MPRSSLSFGAPQPSSHAVRDRIGAHNRCALIHKSRSAKAAASAVNQPSLRACRVRKPFCLSRPTGSDTIADLDKGHARLDLRTVSPATLIGATAAVSPAESACQLLSRS